MQWEQLHQTTLYVRQTLSETSILPAPFVPPERRRRAAGSPWGLKYVLRFRRSPLTPLNVQQMWSVIYLSAALFSRLLLSPPVRLLAWSSCVRGNPSKSGWIRSADPENLLSQQPEIETWTFLIVSVKKLWKKGEREGRLGWRDDW